MRHYKETIKSVISPLRRSACTRVRRSIVKRGVRIDVWWRTQCHRRRTRRRLSIMSMPVVSSMSGVRWYHHRQSTTTTSSSSRHPFDSQRTLRRRLCLRCQCPTSYASPLSTICRLPFLQLRMRHHFIPQCWLFYSLHLSFCRAMLCISAAYAVVRCPSVCPSVRLGVCHVRVFCRNE